jgi:hypothetical protein
MHPQTAREINLGLIALAGTLGLALLATSSLAGTVGAILFGIAIWRDGRSPRWTGVIFALSVALLAVPIALATELLGAMLLLISASVMWWSARQRPALGTPPTGLSEQQAG